MHRVRLSSVVVTVAVLVADAGLATAQQASNWPGHHGPDGNLLWDAQIGEFATLDMGGASNSPGESIWAAPAVSQGKIFIRTLEPLWAIEWAP